MAEIAGPMIFEKYAVRPGVKYCDEDLEKLYLKNTWEPNMSITGCDGLPDISAAGNVVRPKTSVRISMRLSPAMDPAKAQAIIEKKLTTDVPYNAKVTLKGGHSGCGWCIKDLSPELLGAIKQAGSAFFEGRDTHSFASGGSIPFLSELGKMYPTT